MRGPRWTVTAAVTALSMIALLSVRDVSAEKPTATIAGVVKKDEVSRGVVRSVYIKDPDKGDFAVMRGTPVAKELLGLVGSTVTATGYVKKARPESSFERVIDVLSYEVDPPAEGAAPPGRSE